MSQKKGFRKERFSDGRGSAYSGLFTGTGRNTADGVDVKQWLLYLTYGPTDLDGDGVTVDSTDALQKLEMHCRMIITLDSECLATLARGRTRRGRPRTIVVRAGVERVRIVAPACLADAPQWGFVLYECRGRVACSPRPCCACQVPSALSSYRDDRSSGPPAPTTARSSPWSGVPVVPRAVPTYDRRPGDPPGEKDRRKETCN